MQCCTQATMEVVHEVTRATEDLQRDLDIQVLLCVCTCSCMCVCACLRLCVCAYMCVHLYITSIAVYINAWTSRCTCTSGCCAYPPEYHPWIYQCVWFAWSSSIWCIVSAFDISTSSTIAKKPFLSDSYYPPVHTQVCIFHFIHNCKETWTTTFCGVYDECQLW